MNYQKKSNGMFRGWLPVIVIFIAILLLGMVVSKKSKAVEKEKKRAISDSEAAINVVTMELTPRTVHDKLNLPGVVEPWFQVIVSAEVAGRITEKTIEEGTRIEAGQVIARIDSAKYLNAYNAARASYKSAVASKKRLSELYSSRLSNKSDLDDITAHTANAESAMKVAALDLEKCNVVAPVSGIINRIMIEEGQFLDTGAPVAELIRIDRVKVSVGIPESDINAVKGINDFMVSFNGLDGKIFNAKKHFLSRTTTTLARLYDLEVVIDNPDGEILPGMFGRVEIVKKKSEETLSIPLFSIISRDGKKLVFIADENEHHDILKAAFSHWGISMEPPRDRAKKRIVSTGLQEGWMVEITDGLKPGDHVIVSGQRTMSEDQKIKIIKTVSGQEELIQ